uniref:Uncharacterized protein n=1 Tax=Rhizophora mucronata TaxID=61149 RepID=A0A2P2IUJ3_RHIMU
MSSFLSSTTFAEVRVLTFNLMLKVSDFSFYSSNFVSFLAQDCCFYVY